MFIVINCLGMPFNGDTIKTQSLGGSETAAYYLAKELAAQGHKVTMFTNSQVEGKFNGVKYTYAGEITNDTPMGDRFHHYAESTPHEVLIIQRHPAAFRYKWASKVNLWWVHDLAQKRNADNVQAHLWNIDGILTVSEFHKQQYVEVYGLNPGIVIPIQNGVDLSLFEGEIGLTPLTSQKTFPAAKIIEKQVKLLYTSRPERGLEHLVMPEGIMEKLYEIDHKYHLYVCAYDNVTEQMRPYYNYLYARADALPNVTNLGHLTKQELADVMRQCDALVYPTPGPQQPEFEEVSCITAMECMAAGLPFISMKKGALPETCKDSGSILLESLENGLPDVDAFVGAITEMEGWYQTESMQNKSYIESFENVKKMQLEAAKKYSWSFAAAMLDEHINNCFEKHRTQGAIARQLMRESDIYALNTYFPPRSTTSKVVDTPIVTAVRRELEDCYGFAFNNTFAKHYEDYYEYEKQRGVNYGPESLDNNMRFEHVSSLIAALPAASVVLDYGCAHGHYTVNLAKRFPDKRFVGVDIAKSNIETGKSWASEEKITNVEFYHGAIGKEGIQGTDGQRTAWSFEPSLNKYGAIIAAEVIEHIAEPAHYIDTLCEYLEPNGQMIITTPYGPWEAQGYREHYPWRAHLWHFDRADLADLWGHFPNFSIAVAPCGGLTNTCEKLGSYVTTFDNPAWGVDVDSLPGEQVSVPVKSGTINYSRKFELIKPLQTVSLCMIVRNAEATLKRSIDSAIEVVDEIILAVDDTTTDRTREVIDEIIEDRGRYPWPVIKVIDVKSPLEIGFDEARNVSIAEACGDWVLWLDADEILVHPVNIYKYLRNNQFNGYAVRQHHFAVEPLGVLKTDLPCRLFRNHLGIKFFGVVHEHPELALNEGAGHVQLLPDMEIAHQGYTTESIRRGRFDRNIKLLVRDREKYPDRKLGKFLWIRDLAQMCKYELGENGGRITPSMRERALQGIELWEDLLALGELRMLVDGMEFYSILSQVLGSSFEAGFKLDTTKMNGGINLDQAKPIHAHFYKKEHFEKLMKSIFNERVKDYESRYF